MRFIKPVTFIVGILLATINANVARAETLTLFCGDPANDDGSRLIVNLSASTVQEHRQDGDGSPTPATITNDRISVAFDHPGLYRETLEIDRKTGASRGTFTPYRGGKTSYNYGTCSRVSNENKF